MSAVKLLREVNIGVSEEWIDKKVKIKTRYVSRARDTDDVTTAFRPGEVPSCGWHALISLLTLVQA